MTEKTDKIKDDLIKSLNLYLSSFQEDLLEEHEELDISYSEIKEIDTWVESLVRKLK
jgi:hypothetical protein